MIKFFLSDKIDDPYKDDIRKILNSLGQVILQEDIDFKEAHIIFLSSYEEYKEIVDKKGKDDRTTHYFFVWESHKIQDIRSFSLNGDFAFLRGFFLFDDIKNNDEFFRQSIYDAIKKIKRKEELKKKQELVLKNNDYREIGSIVNFSERIENLPSSTQQENFETLLFDKKMFKVMVTINSIIKDRIEAFKKVLNDKNNTKIIEILKDPEKKIFDKDGLIDKSKIRSILVDRDEALKIRRIEPLLLEGDTGVGKTLISRWIYSRLKEALKELGNYNEINASSFSPNLFETELFGHCKGTFTGAEKDKIGKALLSFCGVLFVDEIGDMSLDVQTKFLKFVEEQLFVPEGWQDSKYINCPVFIISATNKNLRKEIENGKFRKDLYARFTSRIVLPDLNERRASIKPIVDYYLQKKLNENKELKISKISNEALNKFTQLDYSNGNFRFFKILIDRIVFKTEQYGLEVILEDIVEKSYNKIKIN